MRQQGLETEGKKLEDKGRAMRRTGISGAPLEDSGGTRENEDDGSPEQYHDHVDVLDVVDRGVRHSLLLLWAFD